jgi:hypothetical protein
MVRRFLKWRWAIARACITPICEGLPQKGRQPTGGRSFGSTACRLADRTKALKALLFP